MPKPWTKAYPVEGRDAFSYGMYCPQDVWTPNPIGEEDCLFLNIYTPLESQKNDDLPVMVWIHGGGNKGGSGQKYDPSPLAADGVIVVTINYRLGLLGQFASEQLHQWYGSTGGMTFLLDQVEALRWVQAHIRDFGGDPDKVTIFGQSAGGYSVCSHLVSPYSEGLFQQAIVESGGCNGPRGFHPKEYGIKKSKACMKAAGCRDFMDGRQSLRCMRKTEVLDLLTDKACEFQPSVDGKVLPARPVDLLRKGIINIPEGKGVMMGFNSADSLIGAPFFHPIKGLTHHQLLNLDSKQYLAHIKYYFPQDYENILTLYPATEDKVRNSRSLIKMNADACFKCPMFELAKVVGSMPMHPTFLYEFSFYNFDHPKRGQFTNMSPHFGEVDEVFDRKHWVWDGYGLPFSRKLGEVMSKTWVAFAKHGYPSNPYLPRWPEFVTTGTQYLVDFNMPKSEVWSMRKDTILDQRCKIWGDARSGKVAEKRIYEFCYDKHDTYVKGN
jgi:carboxylesterase type B